MIGSNDQGKLLQKRESWQKVSLKALTFQGFFEDWKARRTANRIEQLLPLGNGQMKFHNSSPSDIENALRSEGLLSERQEDVMYSCADLFRSF